MGQATVDLPDPLDAPPPSSLSGTDDLLAQLAGDEIDRLLAEADLEHKSSTASAKAAAANPADPAPAPAPQIDSVVSSDGTAVAPVVPAAHGDGVATPVTDAPAAPAEVVPPDDELDALLSKLEESGPSSLIAATPAEPAAAPTAATPPAATDLDSKSLVDRVPDILAQFPAETAPPDAAKDAGAVAPDAAVVTPAAPDANAVTAAAATDAADGLMSAAERDALKISELADEDPASGADADDNAGPGRLAAPLIKLLEVLNAPLSFVPDALRDTLGKVAIVTLVNSVAVLIYVLFMRH